MRGCGDQYPIEEKRYEDLSVYSRNDRVRPHQHYDPLGWVSLVIAANSHTEYFKNLEAINHQLLIDITCGRVRVFGKGSKYKFWCSDDSLLEPLIELTTKIDPSIRYTWAEGKYYDHLKDDLYRRLVVKETSVLSVEKRAAMAFSELATMNKTADIVEAFSDLVTMTKAVDTFYKALTEAKECKDLKKYLTTINIFIELFVNPAEFRTLHALHSFSASDKDKNKFALHIIPLMLDAFNIFFPDLHHADHEALLQFDERLEQLAEWLHLNELTLITRVTGFRLTYIADLDIRELINKLIVHYQIIQQSKESIDKTLTFDLIVFLYNYANPQTVLSFIAGLDHVNLYGEHYQDILFHFHKAYKKRKSSQTVVSRDVDPDLVNCFNGWRNNSDLDRLVLEIFAFAHEGEIPAESIENTLAYLKRLVNRAYEISKLELPLAERAAKEKKIVTYVREEFEAFKKLIALVNQINTLKNGDLARDEFVVTFKNRAFEILKNPVNLNDCHRVELVRLEQIRQLDESVRGIPVVVTGTPKEVAVNYLRRKVDELYRLLVCENISECTQRYEFLLSEIAALSSLDSFKTKLETWMRDALDCFKPILRRQLLYLIDEAYQLKPPYSTLQNAVAVVQARVSELDYERIVQCISQGMTLNFIQYPPVPISNCVPYQQAFIALINEMIKETDVVGQQIIEKINEELLVTEGLPRGNIHFKNFCCRMQNVLITLMGPRRWTDESMQAAINKIDQNIATAFAAASAIWVDTAGLSVRADGIQAVANFLRDTYDIWKRLNEDQVSYQHPSYKRFHQRVTQYLLGIVDRVYIDIARDGTALVIEEASTLLRSKRAEWLGLKSYTERLLAMRSNIRSRKQISDKESGQIGEIEMAVENAFQDFAAGKANCLAKLKEQVIEIRARINKDHHTFFGVPGLPNPTKNDVLDEIDQLNLFEYPNGLSGHAEKKR